MTTDGGHGPKLLRRRSLLDIFKLSKSSSTSNMTPDTMSLNSETGSITSTTKPGFTRRFRNSLRSRFGRPKYERSASSSPERSRLPDLVSTEYSRRPRSHSQSSLSSYASQYDEDDRELAKLEKALQSIESDSDDPNMTPKQAHFREHVEVYKHDSDGRLASRRYERLKTHRALQGEDDGRGKRKRPFAIECMEVKERRGRRYVLMQVNIGKRLADGNVSLRALKDGTKLILTVRKMEPLGDGTEFLRTYVDRFPMPYPINPEAIDAAPGDEPGQLLIQALME